jgi:hypothetical protein
MPKMTRDFFFSETTRLLSGTSSLLQNGYRVSMSGAKQLGPEVDDLHLPSDEAYNSGPHIHVRLHGVDRGKFTVFMAPSRS